jgi:transcription elongation factor GreA
LKSRRSSPIFAVRSEAIVAARRRPGGGACAWPDHGISLASTTEGSSDVQKFPMTAPGLQRLNDELRQLKAEERPAIIRQIAEARTHGDLSENAEYHAARERQSFIEGRIAELEEIVSSAEVIDPSSLSGEHVKFGAHVWLVEEETEKESAYQIVGVHEADIKGGRLSISSPLAKALIGKKVGDTVSVPAPGGDRSYEILGVKFG